LKAIIFDVDDTLADCRQRAQFASDFMGTDQRSEAWYNMFLDGRLYHLDEPIIKARAVYDQLHRERFLREDWENDLHFIMLSGRRDNAVSHDRFKDWLGANDFRMPKRIIFRARGRDTDLWKFSVLMELIEEGYDIIAGYGNERDMPIYEEAGIEAILVDMDGNGWRLPERWPEVIS
jgi:hypothetical protein